MFSKQQVFTASLYLICIPSRQNQQRVFTLWSLRIDCPPPRLRILFTERGALRQYQPWTVFGPRHLPETLSLCWAIEPEGCIFWRFLSISSRVHASAGSSPSPSPPGSNPSGLSLVYGFMLWRSGVCNEIIIIITGSSPSSNCRPGRMAAADW